ncbi:hypothetical protein WMF37_08085 [Sorangium sp. So ce291]|uniref:hypothetical protein n=1 Tax=Sorangium sp. So ce291 TaxID=3133294 RepID=UPI003F628216
MDFLISRRAGGTVAHGRAPAIALCIGQASLAGALQARGCGAASGVVPSLAASALPSDG